jgi:protein TonB
MKQLLFFVVLWCVTITNVTAQSKKDSVTFSYFPEATERTDVFTLVDKDAEYPGGAVALMQFFNKNLKYPELCNQMGISGRIKLRLTIEKDGTVSLIQIRLRNDFDCLKEVESQLPDWLKTMPQWTPAYLNGEAVACFFVIPITVCGR